MGKRTGMICFNRNEQGNLVLLLVYVKARFDNTPAAGGGAMVPATRIYADRIRCAIQPRCPSTAEDTQAAQVASWL
ncbi:hypothetical protein [Variovorax guangxiensis]|uniref:Uncharacterized protein n=1 Tax=Variovorax guangxiensis TaxID=1775474 RepID=A0A840FYB8_9BURK|nr:hypothetical protein [Variovorax guangxiensis]MBB4225762.1 hypothetical protein [Variovorax guangxiensis]